MIFKDSYNFNFSFSTYSYDDHRGAGKDNNDGLIEPVEQAPLELLASQLSQN